MILSDTLIIKLLKNKKQAAIPAILENYGDALYGVIYRRVQSEEQACFIMEQVFLNVWEQKNTYDESEGRLFNWLLKIVNQVMQTDLKKAA